MKYLNYLYIYIICFWKHNILESVQYNNYTDSLNNMHVLVYHSLSSLEVSQYLDNGTFQRSFENIYSSCNSDELEWTT